MKMRITSLLLLICAASFSSSHADFGLTAVAPQDFTLLVPLVAIIVITFLALSSMLAKAISDPKLDAWVKSEIREFFAGIILVAVITAALIGTNSITGALSSEDDFIGAAQGIVEGWLGDFDDSFATLLRAAGRIRTAATYSPYLNIPIWYFSINYSTNTFGGLGILLGPLNIAASALTNAVFLSEALLLMLVFLKIVVPKILLPLSFLARLIPFTRRLGNTLIAVSVAAVVFLPFSVVAADALNGTINMPSPSMDVGKLDANPWAMVMAEPLCEAVPVRSLLFVTEQLFSAIVCLPLLLTPWTAGLYQAPCREPIMHQVVYPLIQLIFQLVNTALLLTWEGIYSTATSDAYVGGAFDEVFGFLKAVNNLVLVIYLDFIFIGIITIGGARSLSTAIGGEWYIAGVQRLI
jgi:hypothetical protein